MSIRERNLTLGNGVVDILGFDKDKTWDDIRRELTANQVKEIHGLYGFLWEPDTDIYSLLPKPDGESRALYTGIIDPRTIPEFALGSAPFFDQVLIQHPFVNPAEVRPKFSPVDSPHRYMHQTVKNVYLLLTLMPYIDAGFVNFFPDPCVFDENLRRQMMDMAEARSGDVDLDTPENEIVMRLGRDDYFRVIRSLPRDSQKRWLTSMVKDMGEAAQHIDGAVIESVLDLMQEQNEEDPLSLLRNGIPDEEDGQLMMMSMAPNLEISFVVAKATGSMLITDQPYRWKEITRALDAPTTEKANPWDHLAKSISSLKYVLDANPETNFHERAGGRYGPVRNAFKRIMQATSSDSGPPKGGVIENLEKVFLASYEKANQTDEIEGSHRVEARIDCRIPDGGFVHNSAHRLLLTSGVETKLDRVPLALFFAKA